MAVNQKRVERLLRPEGPTPAERSYQLVECMEELYKSGLTLRDIVSLFPISLKWLRLRFQERKVKMRPGTRRPTPQAIVDPQRIAEILDDHGVTDNDLRPEKDARYGYRKTLKKKSGRSRRKSR